LCRGPKGSEIASAFLGKGGRRTSPDEGEKRKGGKAPNKRGGREESFISVAPPVKREEKRKYLQKKAPSMPNQRGAAGGRRGGITLLLPGKKEKGMPGFPRGGGAGSWGKGGKTLFPYRTRKRPTPLQGKEREKEKFFHLFYRRRGRFFQRKEKEKGSRRKIQF